MIETREDFRERATVTATFEQDFVSEALEILKRENQLRDMRIDLEQARIDAPVKVSGLRLPRFSVRPARFPLFPDTCRFDLTLELFLLFECGNQIAIAG
jgi:hypothetical protein